MNNSNYFKVAVASSDNFDSKQAIDEVLEKCKNELKGSIPNAGIVYISIYQDREGILNRIMQDYPDLELIGCTHDGVLDSSTSYDEDSVSLTLFSSDVVEIYSGAALDVSKDIEGSVSKALATTLSRSNKTPRICISALPSLTSSGALMTEQMKSFLGEKIPIFGGAAADDWNFKETLQFHKNKIFQNSNPYLLFFGPLIFSSGVESGWVGSGEKMQITKSEGNIVYEIGDKTAVEYFQHYLGENITPLGEYPLVVYENDDEYPYLRAALGADYEKGTLVFAGDVPVGAMVQVGFTNRNKIIEASKKSVEKSLERYSGECPEVLICFSCSARKQVLGSRTGEEYELVRSITSVKVSGFYGYGEIAPVEEGTPTRFHNETFVSLILGIK